MIELVEEKFEEICERDDLAWYELYDSNRFEEVEAYAQSLGIDIENDKEYLAWEEEMYWDL